MIKSRKDVVNQVINVLNPYIEEMAKNQIAWEYERTKRPMSEFGKKIVYLSLVSDLVKALEKYSKIGDELVGKISAFKSGKGSIEIMAKIKRNGEIYGFSSEAILAGGYNVQCLHYRYIVKTNLPKSGEIEDAKAIKKMIQKLSKIEESERLIDNWEKEIEESKPIIAENLKKSDAEIIEILKAEGEHYLNLSWEQVIKNGAAEHFNNNESEWYAYQEESNAKSIEYWKKKNIVWKKDRIRLCGQAIEREKARIQKY